MQFWTPCPVKKESLNYKLKKNALTSSALKNKKYLLSSEGI
jgi:hypothetical protein